jgi:hypothetical protein
VLEFLDEHLKKDTMSGVMSVPVHSNLLYWVNTNFPSDYGVITEHAMPSTAHTLSPLV